MVYLLIFICVLLAVFGWKTEKFILNPLTVFYSIWFIIFFLTSMQLYTLNVASEETYFMMLIGCISFAVGYYCIRKFSKKKQLLIKCNRITIGVKISDNYVIRYNWIFVIGIISILIYLNDATVTLRYLLNGNKLNVIRQMAQDSGSALNSQQSVIIIAIKNLIILPFVMILQPIVAFDFWLEKRNKKLLILNIVLLALRVITDGGRSNLIYFIMHFIVGFLFINSNKKNQSKLSGIKSVRSILNRKKNRKIFIGVIIVGIIFVFWATMSRSGENVLKFAYYYFTMEPYMFEVWAQRVDQSRITGYGLGATNGFTFAVLYILKNLRILSDYPTYWHSINTIIGETQSIWMIISEYGSRANAYVSLFWYFYLDGRIVGIIVGMFVYGGIAASTFWTAVKNMSARTVCMFSFILQGIFMSFVRFQFANIYYAIAFILIFIFYKKVPTVNNE